MSASPATPPGSATDRPGRVALTRRGLGHWAPAAASLLTILYLTTRSTPPWLSVAASLLAVFFVVAGLVAHSVRHALVITEDSIGHEVRFLHGTKLRALPRPDETPVSVSHTPHGRFGAMVRIETASGRLEWLVPRGQAEDQVSRIVDALRTERLDVKRGSADRS